MPSATASTEKCAVPIGVLSMPSANATAAGVAECGRVAAWYRKKGLSLPTAVSSA